MTGQRRYRVLLVSGLAIVAIVLLAAGLPDLQFMPGRSLPGRGGPAEGQEPAFRALPTTERPGLVFLIVGLVAILLLPFAIVQLIRSPELRKKVRRDLVLLILFFALWLALYAPQEVLEGSPTGSSPGPLAEANTLPAVESMLDSTANAPQWLIPLTTWALAVLVTAGLFGVVWFFWRRSHPVASPLEGLAQEAQDALAALEAGADLRDTVMRCYFEMSRVLRERRGIRRAAATTPREFEKQLRQAGLPQTHVERLTTLFERVRYGARIPDEGEERQAVDCLTAIVEVCKGSS